MGSGDFFDGAEAAEGLQGCPPWRVKLLSESGWVRGVAADPGGFDSVPYFRSSSLGDENVCYRNKSEFMIFLPFRTSGTRGKNKTARPIGAAVCHLMVRDPSPTMRILFSPRRAFA
jgi:hypothetical protein